MTVVYVGNTKMLQLTEDIVIVRYRIRHLNKV